MRGWDDAHGSDRRFAVSESCELEVVAHAWRHLDPVLRLEVHARLRRLRCPERGALVDGVPFARSDARFTRDFEDLVAWLATKSDKTATCPLTRIDWHTIGRVIERVGDELLAAKDWLSDLLRSQSTRSRGEKVIGISRSRRLPPPLRGAGLRG